MSSQDDDGGSNNLMTPSSQSLSLSPPRAPPHDSAHRTVMLARNPSGYALSQHFDNKHHHFTGIRHRLAHLLEQSHLHLPSRIPHPHLPAGPELADQVTRALGVTLPIPWLNACRDSGGFRSIADTLVTISAPTMAITSPSLAIDFVKLSRKCKTYAYGSHRMQVIHLLFPDQDDDYQEQDEEDLGNVDVGANGRTRGFVFFVHGGAWGSGLPWMYRLCSLPFLKLGMVVAIVGYRTWPDANVDVQVADLECAASFLAARFPNVCTTPRHQQQSTDHEHHPDDHCHFGQCLMGHSSGAHISLLMLVDRARRKMQTGAATGPIEFDSFVGLSGPYDISHHFDYEAARGVEEFSPLKPVNGYSRGAFRQNSPALRLQRNLAGVTESSTSIRDAFPRMLLLHGIEDTTVPFTATAEAARILRSCGVVYCDEMYVAKLGHQDTVMEVMTERKTSEVVIDWLTASSKGIRDNEQLVGFACRSKL